jgi:hypothetical protein
MNGYQVDWVGAICAGVVAAFVFLVVRKFFPRLTGASFYVVAALLIAALSLVLRELLRRIGI